MLSAKDLIKFRDHQSTHLSFGPKEFEPSGSSQELAEIEQSLSGIEAVISQEKIKTFGSISQAIWHPQLQLAEVTYKTGSQWTTMGHTSNDKLYIVPEEALYLLESGSLEITYNNVPMSIQRAYFILLNSNTGVSLEKYRVYSHLSFLGFKVVRHFSKNTITKYEKQLEMHKLGLKHKNYGKTSEKKREYHETCTINEESVKKFRSCDLEKFPPNKNENESTEDILKKLQIFSPCLDYTESNLNFDYDVYISTTKKIFKKSCLQLPNYRIIVFSSENPMPQLSEIGGLTKKYKDEVPVIYAIVFPDHIAFYEINAVVLPDAFD